MLQDSPPNSNEATVKSGVRSILPGGIAPSTLHYTMVFRTVKVDDVTREKVLSVVRT